MFKMSRNSREFSGRDYDEIEEKKSKSRKRSPYPESDTRKNKHISKSRPNQSEYRHKDLSKPKRPKAVELFDELLDLKNTIGKDTSEEKLITEKERGINAILDDIDNEGSETYIQEKSHDHDDILDNPDNYGIPNNYDNFDNSDCSDNYGNPDIKIELKDDTTNFREDGKILRKELISEKGRIENHRDESVEDSRETKKIIFAKKGNLDDFFRELGEYPEEIAEDIIFNLLTDNVNGSKNEKNNRLNSQNNSASENLGTGKSPTRQKKTKNFGQNSEQNLKENLGDYSDGNAERDKNQFQNKFPYEKGTPMKKKNQKHLLPDYYPKKAHVERERKKRKENKGKKEEVVTTEQSDKIHEKSDKITEKNSDLEKINKLTDKITEKCNYFISECTKQRGKLGKFYEHLKHAEKSKKITPDMRAYSYEFRNTLNKIQSPELTKAVIAGFDTTVDSVGTPGSSLKKIVGKDNPRHKITYRIPNGAEGAFENGKRTITVNEIWGSGQKAELIYNDIKNKWVVDQSTVQIGIDTNTGKERKLHTGELINKKSGEIIPDPKIAKQVRKTKEFETIDGKKVPIWEPYPKTGVGKELAHTSDRYPRAHSKHFLKYYDVNRKETVRLLSKKDHKRLEDDHKEIRKKAKERFEQLKKRKEYAPNLDECFKYARKCNDINLRFNNDNTYPPMDYEQKWVWELSDDEMPKFNGKPYGNKTIKEIYKLMGQFGVTGTTYDVKKYYAGNDPDIAKRFDEYLEGKLQKVELKGEFKDLNHEQQYILTKTREIADYINHFLYHPLFGRMSIDKDSYNEELTQQNLDKYYGKWNEKFNEFDQKLDNYGVPKPKIILPTDKVGTSEENRIEMLNEFMDKNPYPIFDDSKLENIQQDIQINRDIDFDKVESIKELSEILNDVKNYAEDGVKSAKAFTGSFFGHGAEIDGFKIKSNLRLYNQAFAGYNEKLNGTYYKIPPGTRYHSTDKIKEQYNKYWGPVFQRNKMIKKMDKNIKLLESYNLEVLKNKTTLESLNEISYTNSLIKDIDNQINDFNPIQKVAYTNFKQVYDYAGEPRRNFRGLPETISFIGESFKNSNEKFKKLKNYFIKFREDF
ncbi:MAG: hypothetical protein ACTSWY_04505 [Promethearchaeota archaeon]